MFTPLHTAPEGFYGSLLTCLPDKTTEGDRSSKENKHQQRDDTEDITPKKMAAGLF